MTEPLLFEGSLPWEKAEKEMARKMAAAGESSREEKAGSVSGRLSRRRKSTMKGEAVAGSSMACE